MSLGVFCCSPLPADLEALQRKAGNLPPNNEFILAKSQELEEERRAQENGMFDLH